MILEVYRQKRRDSSTTKTKEEKKKKKKEKKKEKKDRCCSKTWPESPAVSAVGSEARVLKNAWGLTEKERPVTLRARVDKHRREKGFQT